MQRVWHLFLLSALLILGAECGVLRRRIVVPQDIVLPESQRRASQFMPSDGSFSANLDIRVDFRYFLNDPSRNCLNAGERVPLGFGGPVDATNCTDLFPGGNWTQSALEPNCTIVCDSEDTVSSTGQRSESYFRELFGQVRALPRMATSFIGRAVKILPHSGFINVNASSACGFFGGGVPVPNFNNSRHPGSLLVFVTGRPMMTSSPALFAVSSVCQVDQYGRPTIAHLNINPRMFPRTDFNTKARDRFVRIGIRELIHVMGFADDMFDEWRVTDLDVPVGRAGVISESFFSASDNIGNFRLVTPSTLAAAKTLFNCDTLPNVELENYGGPYIAKTYFETRLFRDELMAGQPSGNMTFSTISQAVLKDMGWYRADPAALEPYVYLRGVGCPALAAGDCPRSPLNSGFCEVPQQLGCSFDQRFTATCNFVLDLGFSLPTYYQHYPDNRTGSASAFADYCPYFSPAVDCTDRLLDTTLDSLTFGTAFNDASRCFVGRTYNFSATTAPPAELPNCFMHACNSNGTALKVRVGRSWYDCNTPGVRIDINVDFNGTVLCPTQDKITNILCAPGYRNRIDIWPSISKVNVTEVSRTGMIQIDGAGFSPNMGVYAIGQGFASDLTNIVVLSDSQIVATIPNVTWTIPADRTQVHLIVMWTNDGDIRRSAYLRNAFFVLRSYNDLTWQEKAYNWMFIENLIFSIIMLCVLFIIICLCLVIIIYRCCKGKCRCCCCK